MKNKFFIVLTGAILVGVTFLYSLAQKPNETKPISAPIVSDTQVSPNTQKKIQSSEPAMTNQKAKINSVTSYTPLPTSAKTCDNNQKSIKLLQEESDYSNAKAMAKLKRDDWVSQNSQNQQARSGGATQIGGSDINADGLYNDLISQIEAKHSSNLAKINSSCY